MDQLATQSPQARQTPAFIGESQQARRIRHFAQLASESEHTVLILGESGTGKDHLAEYIHGMSGLPGSFVRVDCGALSSSLTETELFGHVQGAFTDAKTAKPGLLKAAEGGTIFFNEVTNMSLDTQAKFLAIVEKKPFRPVGSIREVAVNTRIIAATNADLKQKIKRGEFRSDLFYRLDCLTCEVAPLRERREDIPILTAHFEKQWHKTARFTGEAVRLMMEQPWPGNIRQLEAFIKKVLVFSTEDEIGARAVASQLDVQSGADDLPEEPTHQQEGEGLINEDAEEDAPEIVEEFSSAVLHELLKRGRFPTIKEWRCAYIPLLLKRTDGNMTRAAKIAKTPRSNLYKYVAQLGLKHMLKRHSRPTDQE